MYFYSEPTNQFTMIHSLMCACVGSACHLYFDIEFNLESNPRVDGPTLLETFIQVILLPR